MAENNRQLSLSWQLFMEGLAEISLMFGLANGSFRKECSTRSIGYALAAFWTRARRGPGRGFVGTHMPSSLVRVVTVTPVSANPLLPRLSGHRICRRCCQKMDTASLSPDTNQQHRSTVHDRPSAEST
jgi:hypothetical protein